MSDENPIRDPADKHWMAERGIVLQVLRNDHAISWTRAELEREISDLPKRSVRLALRRLAEEEEVVIVDGKQVQASRCARHLDTLGLIAV
jgi:hypothetical protein